MDLEDVDGEKEMTKKPIVIIYKESLAQSIISDLFTFGFLLICMWASWGSTGWTFLSACLFLVFLVGTARAHVGDVKHQFYSLDEVREWLDKQETA